MIIALTAEFGIAAFVFSVVILIALLLFVAVSFNRLVRYNNLVDEAFSGIDVQLKRRHELIPNLVECVKGYANFERSLIEDVVAARSSTATTNDMAGLNAKENGLTANLVKFLALAEAYPELKADTNFTQLSAQLVEVEDAIQYSRRYFNGAVRNLNISIESFPSNLVANLFDFTTKEFFEVESVTERATPIIDAQALS
ncbi:MAG TPA: hypothetical protein DD662_07855 [Planctomycetaceae bacterium]|jgi:LemA protein|nr:hypothetical protein [Planctomycetaceae bacterium]|tara:strand:- start:836 stop:1432 length:597 start_codon:yes stop_codon:yes gene_type:complete